ncbi:MAG: hypothetical protein NVSMB9_35800 [Isosphaeraceae bacterium]
MRVPRLRVLKEWIGDHLRFTIKRFMAIIAILAVLSALIVCVGFREQPMTVVTYKQLSDALTRLDIDLIVEKDRNGPTSMKARELRLEITRLQNRLDGARIGPGWW